jgi:hypothetical protein
MIVYLPYPNRKALLLKAFLYPLQIVNLRGCFMKRIFAGILCLALSFVFVACGKTTAPEETTTTTAARRRQRFPARRRGADSLAAR